MVTPFFGIFVCVKFVANSVNWDRVYPCGNHFCTLFCAKNCAQKSLNFDPMSHYLAETNSRLRAKVREESDFFRNCFFEPSESLIFSRGFGKTHQICGWFSSKSEVNALYPSGSEMPKVPQNALFSSTIKMVLKEISPVTGKSVFAHSISHALSWFITKMLPNSEEMISHIVWMLAKL